MAFDTTPEHLRHALVDGVIGASAGVVLALYTNERPAVRGALGAVLGVLGGALLRNHLRGHGSTSVGWSQPPHPIDVIPSFNPSASKRDQARAILNNYYHDDATRSWADNDAVKHAFGVKQKEDYDPALLIQAYENPHHKVWTGHGDGTNWKDLDSAVQAAISRRKKLGPLPASSYDTDPVVIYYYDNDRMKKITYPRQSIPAALNPNQLYWWRWGQGDQSDAGKKKGLDDVHTKETTDPKAIAAERAKPGFPGGGNWGDEGESWDKDAVGNVGAITGQAMQWIGFILEIIPGIGTAIGTTIVMAAPYMQTIVNAVDVSIQGGDNATALAGIGKILIQAAATGLKYGAKIDIPTAAVQACGVVVDQVAAAVDAAQKQKLDYSALWQKVGEKAKTFGKLGDDQAHMIAVVLGEDTAGKVFIAGHQAGKLADPPAIAAIAKIVSSMASFSDPKIVNLFLLGAGIGHITKVQEANGHAVASHALPASTHPVHATHAAHATSGFFYDPDLAQFGNAMSPFISEEVMPYDRAVQAMNLPLEDRYGPRGDAPNWADWYDLSGLYPNW